MSWDYRVIEHDEMFYIHEVYYNANGDICAISENPSEPAGETPEELKDDIEYFRQALDKPALKLSNIVFAPMGADEEA